MGTPMRKTQEVTKERGCGTASRGHHLLRKRAAREAATSDDPEIRRCEDNRHRKRAWTCCICSKEFVDGDESEDIHFCSFHDCQHVMCADQDRRESDLYERPLDEFQEYDSAQYRRWRRISSRLPANVDIFQGVQETCLAADVRVDVISRAVLSGHDPEGLTLIPRIPLDTGLRSERACCHCGAQDTEQKPLVCQCWYSGDEGKCLHVYCQEHCRTVGRHNYGGMNIEWCYCHDTICLPCDPEPWERYPGSDEEEYDPNYPEDVSWNDDERRRRRHLPQNLHEGSSSGSHSDSETTLMMGGHVVADSDRAAPTPIRGRAVRKPEAQLGRPESASQSNGVYKVDVETSTMDDIDFINNGQGFVYLLNLQLTNCRQGLLCARGS
eukprot:1816950-Amphidinium_carterae.1